MDFMTMDLTEYLPFLLCNHTIVSKIGLWLNRMRRISYASSL